MVDIKISGRTIKRASKNHLRRRETNEETNGFLMRKPLKIEYFNRNHLRNRISDENFNWYHFFLFFRAHRTLKNQNAKTYQKLMSNILGR